MKEKVVNEFSSMIRNVIREEFRNLMKPQPRWMRSSLVKEMLNISDSTLQTLRINGTIPAYKLGTTWLYKQDEIINVLESNKIGGRDNND